MLVPAPDGRLASMNLDPDCRRSWPDELRSERVRHQLYVATPIMQKVRRDELRDQRQVILAATNLDSSRVWNRDGPKPIRRIDLASQRSAVGRINEPSLASDRRRRPAHE